MARARALRRETAAHPRMGERLREARQARSLSLRDLAERVGVSASLISQIETGRARPSVNTLYALAAELDVSLDDLAFDDEGHIPAIVPAPTPGGAVVVRGDPVQRATDRQRLRLASGVVWERLTTISEPETEFLFVTYEVGGASSSEHEFQRHRGREWGYVLEGRLTIQIGFDEHELGPGDAIALDSTTPHRLANRGDVPVHAVWFVLGRRSMEGR
jgi:DNA-binding XRE family transcriptional regulator/quercetin dioxygenase-like cupin family protein